VVKPREPLSLGEQVPASGTKRLLPVLIDGSQIVRGTREQTDSSNAGALVTKDTLKSSRIKVNTNVVSKDETTTKNISCDGPAGDGHIRVTPRQKTFSVEQKAKQNRHPPLGATAKTPVKIPTRAYSPPDMSGMIFEMTQLNRTDEVDHEVYEIYDAPLKSQSMTRVSKGETHTQTEHMSIECDGPVSNDRIATALVQGGPVDSIETAVRAGRFISDAGPLEGRASFEDTSNMLHKCIAKASDAAVDPLRTVLEHCPKVRHTAEELSGLGWNKNLAVPLDGQDPANKHTGGFSIGKVKHTRRTPVATPLSVEDSMLFEDFDYQDGGKEKDRDEGWALDEGLITPHCLNQQAVAEVSASLRENGHTTHTTHTTRTTPKSARQPGKKTISPVFSTRGAKKSAQIAKSVHDTNAQELGKGDALKAMQPCRFHHKKGGCRLGARCKYSHDDIPSGTDSSLDDTTDTFSSDSTSEGAPFSLKANVYKPPDKEEIEVYELDTTIFVSRSGPGSYANRMVWIACVYFVLLLAETLGITENVGRPLCEFLMTVTVVSGFLIILAYLLIAVDGLVIKARLTEVGDDIDDRCSSDRGKALLLGKVYNIERYIMVVDLTFPMFVASPNHIPPPITPQTTWQKFASYFSHATWKRGINFVFNRSMRPAVITINTGAPSTWFTSIREQLMMYFLQHVTHTAYFKDLRRRGVTFGRAPSNQFISSAMLMELNSRKTMYSTDPQFNTIAQRTDNVAMYSSYLNKYGSSVGNTTINLIRLQHASMNIQPFVNRLPSFVYNMDTASTTRAYTQPTQTSNQTSGLTQEVTGVTSAIYSVLLSLAQLTLAVLVIVCISQILVTSSVWLADARNASGSNPHDATVGPEGHLGALQSYLSKHWKPEDFFNHLTKKRMFPSESGSKAQTTQQAAKEASSTPKMTSENLIRQPPVVAMLMMMAALGIILVVTGIAQPNKRVTLMSVNCWIVSILGLSLTYLMILGGSCSPSS